MRITKKTISLYAVPEAVIPEEAVVGPSSCSLPAGLLPATVLRCDSNLGEKLAAIFAWYKENLVERDGYLVASAALPALSLDKTMWAEALGLLKEALAGYEVVQGAVFVQQSVGRTAQFAVADRYTKMLHGSTTLPCVTWKQAPVVPVEQPETVMPNNHIQKEAIVANDHVDNDPALEQGTNML